MTDAPRAAFRFGQIKIPADDFKLIANAMGVEAKPNENRIRARIQQRPDK